MSTQDVASKRAVLAALFRQAATGGDDFTTDRETEGAGGVGVLGVSSERTDGNGSGSVREPGWEA